MILVRSTDIEMSGDGRTIEGLAFRWDTPSHVTDNGTDRYWEEFSRRSVTKTLSDRPSRPLFVAHEYVNGSVGEVTFRDSSEGLVYVSRTDDNSHAREALKRVNDGVLRSVSVGFAPLKNLTRSDAIRGLVTVRDEIRLAELSLCEKGQHEGAAVLSVRSAAGTPRLDALRRKRTLFL